MRRLGTTVLIALALAWISREASAQNKAQLPPPSVAWCVAKYVEPMPAPVQPAPAPCPCPGVCDTACAEQDHGHFFAGGGLYLLQPYFHTNPAFSTFIQTGTGANKNTNVQQTDFRYHWDGAPEIFLGYVNCDGFGGRVRYFQYAHSSSQSVLVPPADPAVTSALGSTAGPLGLGNVQNLVPGDQYNFFSNLGVLVWDFELGQWWSHGCWQLGLTGGVRYAHIDQNYQADGPFHPFAAAILRTNFSLDSGHNFNGAGPTLALESRREIGRRGLALYGNARGSLLFGSAHQTVFRTLLDTAGNVQRQDQASASQADTIPVLEGEVGAEYGRDIGRIRAFLRIGFVGQAWFGAGNASNSGLVNASGFNNVFFNGNTSTVHNADNNSNLGLSGLVVRAGVTY